MGKYTSSDVDELVAIVEERLQPIRPSNDELWDQTLQERDQAVRAADDLTEAVSKLLRVPFGEHSNANEPWRNALIQAAIASLNR